jgi:hypothetical protein
MLLMASADIGERVTPALVSADDYRSATFASTAGRLVMAAAFAGFACQYFLLALNAGRLIPGPPWVHAGAGTAWIWGLLFLALAVGMALRPVYRRSAILLFALLGIFDLLWYIPQLVARPRNPGLWTSTGEVAALAGAALVLYRKVPRAVILFAAPLVIFGIQHFLYSRYVAGLIPSWIPLRLFWSYAVGVAFLAAACSITLQRFNRLAGQILALMFGLWVLMVHLPRIAGAPRDGNELTSGLICLAFCGASLIVSSEERAR